MEAKALATRKPLPSFLSAQKIQSYYLTYCCKIEAPAVTAKSGHDSDDDNDSQEAQEQETYSSARLAVLGQCDLLRPIVYDTLNICFLYSSNKLSKLSVAQLRLTCSYYNMDIEKKRLTLLYLGSCKILFLR